MSSKTFTVHIALRHEYQNNYEWLDNDTCITTTTYTGKTTTVISNERGSVLCRLVPEWKSEIISTCVAELGHTGNGAHKYMIDRTPITILN